MKEKEFTLSHEHRRLVERTIRRHCELRRWALHAINARRFWTEGGRCDWIHDEAGLESVVTYVLEAQDRKGRDEAP